MNTKIAVGLVVLLVLFGAGYLVLQKAPATAPSAATSTPASASVSSTTAPGAVPASRSSAPTYHVGAPVRTLIHKTVTLDPASLTTTSPYPVITGTANNTASLYIVVSNAGGKGLMAATVSVVDGKWSYPLSVALTPDTYTVTVAIDGQAVVSSPLVIN